jgi:hypothetical protein
VIIENSKKPTSCSTMNWTKQEERAGVKIKAFVLKHLTKRFANIGERVKYYQYVHSKCISQQLDSLVTRADGYEAGSLLLTNRMGTDGKFGEIYRTVCPHNGLVNLVSKIMPANVKDNTNEVRVNLFVTELVKKGISRHFLMTHVASEVTVPDRDKKHYLVVNEFAHGDLKALIADPAFLVDNTTVFNACIQCLLSIVTFHSYGFNHNDCHWGNFLFQKQKKTDTQMYSHYSIYGKDYYLVDCGYNMMLYDFGLVTKHDESGLAQNLAIEDYRRVLLFFMLSQDPVKYEKDVYGLIESNNKSLKKLSLFCQNLHWKLFKDVRTSEKLKQEKMMTEYIVTPAEKLMSLSHFSFRLV